MSSRSYSEGRINYPEVSGYPAYEFGLGGPVEMANGKSICSSSCSSSEHLGYNLTSYDFLLALLENPSKNRSYFDKSLY